MYDVSYTTDTYMIASHIDSIILYIWVALGTLWLVLMAFTKRTARTQSVGARSLHIAIILPGYLLLVDAKLAIGEWRCVIGLFLLAFAFVLKIRQEESVMLQAFPDVYPAYHQRVKALIPGLF